MEKIPLPKTSLPPLVEKESFESRPVAFSTVLIAAEMDPPEGDPPQLDPSDFVGVVVEGDLVPGTPPEAILSRGVSGTNDVVIILIPKEGVYVSSIELQNENVSGEFPTEARLDIGRPYGNIIGQVVEPDTFVSYIKIQFSKEGAQSLSMGPLVVRGWKAPTLEIYGSWGVRRVPLIPGALNLPTYTTGIYSRVLTRGWSITAFDIEPCLPCANDDDGGVPPT